MLSVTKTSHAHRLERRAGGIRRALVVARDHPHAIGPLDPDLRRSQHVSGGMKADGGAAKTDGLTVGQRFDGGSLAEPPRQQRRARRGAQIGRAPASCVVAVRVGDERARRRAPGIDVKVACRAVEPDRGLDQHDGSSIARTRHVSDATSARVSSRHLPIGSVPMAIGSELDADELQHVRVERLHHAAHLAVAPFGEHDFEVRVLLGVAHARHLRRPRRTVRQLDAVAQPLQLRARVSAGVAFTR